MQLILIQDKYLLIMNSQADFTYLPDIFLINKTIYRYLLNTQLNTIIQIYNVLYSVM